ncbi:uncharacterized protein LOC143552058 [Bidens hawaiensis]|uniref:uncharacterized protein LOC143552058 n=1 Tax=Bidens hawaiensis TaxID=980011 RepID=UPI0040496ACA
MESKGVARVYQDFKPSMEWVPEDDSDTLLVYLPGFAKEQLRVQLRSRNLIISGERKLQQNTWSRFRVEFPVSANCDLNKISAKFEGHILFVRQPKLITPAPKVPAEEKPADESNVDPTETLKENKRAEKDLKAREDATPEKEKGEKSKKGVVYEELDKSTKMALENYKRAAGVFAMKLKTSSSAVNMIVILFLGLLMGIYVSSSIISWSKA